ncbi:MAG TPA: FAD-dependent oxidoreductase [Anaerolineaceae bacterium]|nr:FAD-dependent oxidoreductase [Anaerolineaceae bacterium]
MPKVVVIGGGWAGCAAALSAKKAGSDVALYERTDCLLGTGLVGGIFRNNGRFTAAEEMIAMGGGDLFMLADQASRHANVDFPGHKHSSLYDVCLMEPSVRRALREEGVEVNLIARAMNVIRTGDRLEAIKLENGEIVEGDVFVETTGTAGPQGNCVKYGNGCAMCVLRCDSWGGRVSIAGRAGIEEKMGRKADGTIGAMSGSCKLHKDSVDPGIVAELNRTGVAVVPIPKHLVHKEKLATKACQQYALPEFAENLVLLDTGHVKLMTPFYPLEELRSIPGMENARFEDPYSGGKGNSIRYLALSPRDDYLQVQGLDNLFCAGEKAGLLVGHTEAIATGVLAGHNAVRSALGKELVAIPQSTAIGDSITFVREQMETEAGMGKKYTFSGDVYFKRMKELGLYTTDIPVIQERVEAAGFSGYFAKRLI